MRRRSFLAGLSASALGSTAGCIAGGGGELVVSVQKQLAVEPGSGWVKEIPDVSEDNGTISYVARADRPFDVYFFTTEEEISRYRAYPDVDNQWDLPTGDREIGRTATKVNVSTYQASTADNGTHQPIEAEGPSYFVLDHSNYPAAGGAFLRKDPDPRDVQLSLEVKVPQFDLPF